MGFSPMCEWEAGESHQQPPGPDRTDITNHGAPEIHRLRNSYCSNRGSVFVSVIQCEPLCLILGDLGSSMDGEAFTMTKGIWETWHLTRALFLYLFPRKSQAVTGEWQECGTKVKVPMKHGKEWVWTLQATQSSAAPKELIHDVDWSVSLRNQLNKTNFD